jgi:hypothetical protein
MDITIERLVKRTFDEPLGAKFGFISFNNY